MIRNRPEIPTGHIVISTLVMLIVYYVTANTANLVSLVTVRTIIYHFPGTPEFLGLAICYILSGLIVFGGSFGASYFLQRRFVPDHYPSGQVTYSWLRSAVCYLAPCEIIRLVVSLFNCAAHSSVGYYWSYLPSLIYNNSYLLWTGRYTAVHKEGLHIFSDYLVYALYYLVYLAIHLAVVLLIYRRFWRIGKQEREDLVIRT